MDGLLHPRYQDGATSVSDLAPAKAVYTAVLGMLPQTNVLGLIQDRA